MGPAATTRQEEVAFQASPVMHWDQQSKPTVAVLVDVDGTLVGPYKAGTRTLRPSAQEALRLLEQQTPVFLWSIARGENWQRLLEE